MIGCIGVAVAAAAAAAVAVKPVLAQANRIDADSAEHLVPIHLLLFSPFHTPIRYIPYQNEWPNAFTSNLRPPCWTVAAAASAAAAAAAAAAGMWVGQVGAADAGSCADECCLRDYKVYTTARS
ncbi:unnamed protein product [Taenia asiatica]|uniref:Secreted protein n=1 Tax=Taenia asiatica TaxID=60517 RepID=A0A0R3WCW9_TAEAS|nr:unnamed protein product [Taenia asiatica]